MRSCAFDSAGQRSVSNERTDIIPALAKLRQALFRDDGQVRPTHPVPALPSAEDIGGVGGGPVGAIGRTGIQALIKINSEA